MEYVAHRVVKRVVIIYVRMSSNHTTVGARVNSKLLYKYKINRHAGTPNTTITKGTISLDTAQFVTLGTGSDGYR